ncbi:molybdate ABC transporter substrate-binding protein [Inquilinus sp. KBS0705]|nr:molybdate ABC transporter substrate-binding protein [Inquilinus sp. KBS0705]
MTKTTSFKYLLTSACLLWQLTAHAQNLKVAIAANLQPVIKVLQQDFGKQTGIGIDAISGPSGNLSTQISNGAPFDLFLSADTKFPAELYKKGFALKEPVVYAEGALIICSSQNINLANWAKLLPGATIKKIAIGNPAIAPYGKAAQETLMQAGIYDTIKDKIVYGESISQVNTYVTTGVVPVAFTTLSLIKDPANKTPLFYRVIDPKTYSPIQQGMVLLKHAQGNTKAEKFYRYLLSPAAKKIFIRFGYHVK